MKTAAKISMTALLSVLGAGWIVGNAAPALAQAAEISPVVIQGSAAAAQAVPPGPVTAADSKPAFGEQTAKEVLDTIKAPATAPDVKKEPVANKATDKNIKTASSVTKMKAEAVDEEDDDQGSDFPPVTAKMPDSVKNVVKRLNSATEGVTLDDLNSAREAIAKLDVLIDIEKRLSDLADIRKEREEKVGLLEGAIPESALKGNKGFQAPPVILPSSNSAVSPQITLQPVQTGPASLGLPAASLPSVVPMPMGGGMEPQIVRISGANANYTAQIKEASGSIKRVRVGDKLPDGSVVTAISSKGLTYTLPDHKTTKSLEIKDISMLVKGRPGGV